MKDITIKSKKSNAAILDKTISEWGLNIIGISTVDDRKGDLSKSLTIIHCHDTVSNEEIKAIKNLVKEHIYLKTD